MQIDLDNQIADIINHRGNTLYIADGAVEYVIEKFRDHLKNLEIKAKLPSHIILRSMDDSTTVCELKLLDSGKV